MRKFRNRARLPIQSLTPNPISSTRILRLGLPIDAPLVERETRTKVRTASVAVQASAAPATLSPGPAHRTSTTAA